MKDGGLQWIKLYFFISISSKERTTTELIAFAEAPMMDKLSVDPCFPSNLQSKEESSTIRLHWTNWISSTEWKFYIFPEYFLWNWTKLWKLDFPTFFYNISKILPLNGRRLIFPVHFSHGPPTVLLFTDISILGVASLVVQSPPSPDWIRGIRVGLVERTTLTVSTWFVRRP